MKKEIKSNLESDGKKRNYNKKQNINNNMFVEKGGDNKSDVDRGIRWVFCFAYRARVAQKRKSKKMIRQKKIRRKKK